MNDTKSWPCGRMTQGSAPKDDAIPCGTRLYANLKDQEPRVHLCAICKLKALASPAAS